DPARVGREKGMETLESMGIPVQQAGSGAGELCGREGCSSSRGEGGAFSGQGVYRSPAPVVGVSVREWPGFGEPQQRALARVCDDLCHRGYRVLFIPLQFPEDLSVSRQVAAMMESRAAVLDRGLTVDEAVSLVACLDLLIGMRLHALVLAAVMGVPPVGISYDPKIGRFLARLGLRPAGEASGLEYGVLRRAVEEVLADPAGFRASLARMVGPLKERARATARLACARLPGLKW
ncbi:polysaccharide pyruvyl transferase family protein, partial [Desulfofundulus sp.]|uniref:polysaccharide pyruvyl transferase family protein n=1 Tax=Desulfofundulus sp. TaxID=2282750 RepID=UPI003C7897F0